MPRARSPSIDLKSLTIAMPRPAIEYRIVSTTSAPEMEAASNIAWPHHHGSAMYDEPSAYLRGRGQAAHAA